MKQTLENSLRLFGISSSFILLALISLLAFADIASAQRTQPVTTPPDSVLTGDRRKSEELKRRQQEELNKEAEARRIDSIRNAQREQEEVLAKAREIQRQDSARAAERIAAEERERIRMQTPMPWKAIGIGGGIGIGNMPMILGKPTLTPTSVLASTIQLSTFLTRRLDFTVSLTKMTVGDDFPGDSVYHYGFVGNTGKGTPASFKYTPSKYQPGTYLVQGEDIHISAFGIDARYAITPPSAVMQFYLGVGYSYLTMTNTQRYQLALDSIHSDNQLHEYTESFHRGAIKLLFGMRHDFELGNDFTLSPFAQISALGAFQGDDQNFAFVFAPDREQIIMTHLSVGATLYWGWFGVPRIR